MNEKGIMFPTGTAGSLAHRIHPFIHQSTNPSSALLHDQAAGDAFGFVGEALAEVVDDLVVEVLAAGAPALGAHQVLDAPAQAGKAQHGEAAIQLAAQHLAQPHEKHQLEAFAGFGRQARQIRDRDALGCQGGGHFGAHVEAEVLEHPFERLVNGSF